MTTFTLQDLTPAQQEAVKQHEAMLSAYSILNTRSINNLPTTTEEDEAMQALSEKQFVEYGMNNPISASAIEYATQHATTPQPSGENPHNSQVSPEAVIDEMLFTIKQSLLLLATVINQSKAQPEGAQGNSLQECVSLTLQQADWFRNMVRETIVDEVSLEDVVKDIVKDEIESEVESYFSNQFDPTYHFDFGDAVSSEVSDQLDDVVRDRLDEVVQEQLEEVVAEKLKSIRVVFD
jgi:hypothetical protein